VAQQPSTLTGWFSDDKCATGRVKQGLIGPTNPVCAKQCLDSGASQHHLQHQWIENVFRHCESAWAEDHAPVEVNQQEFH